MFHITAAGIKIWVCTGDKQETAINIGFSCKLLTPDMELLILNENDLVSTTQFVEEQLSKVCPVLLVSYPSPNTPHTLSQRPSLTHALQYDTDARRADEETMPKLALIIDGNTLDYALHVDVRDKWLKLAKLCKAVIACRVSPLQKAEIVK